MRIVLQRCPKCQTEFNAWSLWGLKKFCSRKCANSRGPRSDEFKAKVSKKLTGKTKTAPSATKGKHLVPRVERTCQSCQEKFIVKTSDKKKYCSVACRKKHAGGYREGSGRAKVGYYKGVYCGSTYELCWVIYNLDHGVKFTRFNGCLEKDGVKYYPDFLLADKTTIVEIKGYEGQTSVDKKTAVAEAFGYNVVVLRKSLLEKEFEYVAEKYSPNFKSLYDDYKPKFSYVCCYCYENFSRDKKLKTEVVFCSRQCAGKGHRGRYSNKQKDTP